MTLPANRTSDEVVIRARMADLSTASSVYLVSPVRGRIARIFSVINNAITGADSKWTAYIGSTAIALATNVTVANSGSAAGDVDSADLGRSSDAVVDEGSLIKITSDGASSTTCVTDFAVVIRRR